MLKRKKKDLFNLWVENEMDWDRVQCVVERAQETSNLARKEWVAVQAKELKASMEKERFDDLIAKRVEAGLYYKDEDYPEDPMDWGFKKIMLCSKSFACRSMDSQHALCIGNQA